MMATAKSGYRIDDRSLRTELAENGARLARMPSYMHTEPPADA